jgi:hypothetical protein
MFIHLFCKCQQFPQVVRSSYDGLFLGGGGYRHEPKIEQFSHSHHIVILNSSEYWLKRSYIFLVIIALHYTCSVALI